VPHTGVQRIILGEKEDNNTMAFPQATNVNICDDKINSLPAVSYPQTTSAISLYFAQINM
jgi:hypothetical protein